MLVQNEIDEITPIVREGIAQLFENVRLNQHHPQDLLMVITDTRSLTDKRGDNFLLIGRDLMSLSHQSQLLFIEDYLQRFPPLINPEGISIERETLSIHSELVIYIKIWEFWVIVRLLHRLSLLAQGRQYDWHYKEKISKKDIISTLNMVAPQLAVLIDSTFNSKIRNSIAHSDYLLMDNEIIFLKEGSMFSRQYTFTFEEWRKRFTSTFLIYKTLMQCVERENDRYIQLALKDKSRLEIPFVSNVTRENVYLTPILDHKVWLPTHYLDAKTYSFETHTLLNERKPYEMIGTVAFQSKAGTMIPNGIILPIE